MSYRTMLIGTRPVALLSSQAAKGQTFTVANFDLTNPVYVSSEKAVSPSTSDAIAIPPLGSMPISGDIDTYAASGVAAGISIGVMPGSGGWTPSPAQVSAQINALGLAKDTTVTSVVNNTTGVSKDSSLTTINGTLGAPAQDGSVVTVGNNVNNVPTGVFNTGVPLAHKNTVLLNSSPTTIPNTGANTQVGGTLSFTQHSYEMRINFRASAAGGTVAAAVINVQWIDSSSGLVTGYDTYTSLIAATTDTSGFFTRIVGPTKADTAKIFIQNLDTVNCTAAVLVLAHSRAITSDSLDCPNFASNSICTAGSIGATGDSRFLTGVTNAALAAGATDSWMVTPSVGPIYLNVFETGVAFANMVIQLRMWPNSFYANSGNTWLINDVMASGNPNKFVSNLTQSGGPMQFRITNNGAVNANYAALIVRQQALS
jgi:hypothetical protein